MIRTFYLNQDVRRDSLKRIENIIQYDYYEKKNDEEDFYEYVRCSTEKWDHNVSFILYFMFI